MTDITFKGTPVHTVGALPEVGARAPAFTLTGKDLADVTLEGFAGKRVVLNIVVSVDTGVCAKSARAFNERAASLPDTALVTVSLDLPFALGRFCAAEGIEALVMASGFRADFGERYGVTMQDGPLRGCTAARWSC